MDPIELELSEPIKQDLTKDLQHIADDIRYVMDKITYKGCGLLNDFEHIHGIFNKLHMTAASYYLNSYLSPFTDEYDELAKTVHHLSERNHGALIVVERNDRLDSLIHSGTPVDAKLSSQLLESIFYPGGPLHDGAVLVRDSKIISAGNILPLSQYSTSKKKLGTRHRAAIGLSEVSDALILVVSEETGRVSFALGGHLYPVHNGEFLQ